MSDHATAQHTRLADMANLAVIQVTGVDAANFLHAQLSNDVLHLDRSHSALAAWCDPKGRALATLRVFRRDNGFVLLLPATLKQTLLKRLKMFVLRAKVELTDANENLSCFALFGAEATQAMTEIMPPPEENSVTTVADLQCLRLPGSVASYLIIGPPSDSAASRQRLRTHSQAATYNGWLLDRINAGEPQVFAQTQGVFVPQMLNLHWLAGIDFQKGCYPGQEVVARLHYRGKLTRRMYLAQIDSPDTPAPGDIVAGPDDTTLGQVVAAAPTDDHAQRLLAVLKVGADMQHANIGGAPLKLLELPYDTSS